MATFHRNTPLLVGGRKYAAVKHTLLQRIAAGRYSGTKPVPPERVLAAELGVAGMTARRAIQDLVAEGLLVRHPGRGRGTFVRQKPTPSAANASTTELRRLGVIHQNEGASIQSDPIQFLTFLEIQAACFRRGVSVEFLPVAPDANAGTIVKTAAKCGCQALIALSWNDSPELARVHAAGLPVVVPGPFLEKSPLPYVCPNDFQGGLIVTRRLIELGHPGVAMVNFRPKNLVSADRQVGWQAAIGEGCGYANSPKYVVDRPPQRLFAQTKDDLRRLFEKMPPPSAIFARDGYLGYAAIVALRELGVECPRDVSVACVGSFFERTLEMPHMTTAVPHDGSLGRATLRLAEDLLAGRQDEPIGIVLPMRLIEGETTRQAKGGAAPGRVRRSRPGSGSDA